VDYIKHIEIPKVHLCCGQVMMLHRIFFMNLLFSVKKGLTDATQDVLV
jgi:hypothetical protein